LESVLIIQKLVIQNLGWSSSIPEYFTDFQVSISFIYYWCIELLHVLLELKKSYIGVSYSLIGLIEILQKIL